MLRRALPSLLCPVTLAISLGLGADAGAKAARPTPKGPRPNIILISVDTLRRDHLPLYGYERDTAPRLTSFARSSVVFDNAIAADTNTAPSHASMLTGRYPQTHGIFSNRHHLRRDVPTLAELLGKQGYQTAALISGYTLLDSTTGLARGFEHYDDNMGKPGERYAHQVQGLVKRFLDQDDPARPLFYFIHLFDPHYPYVPPEPFLSRFAPEGAARVKSRIWSDLVGRRKRGFSAIEHQTYEARYDSEIRFTDRYVGLILKELKGRGLFENSLIIFTADHGETLSERPFSYDHGGRLYDEQIRIPLVMRFPRGARGGRRVAADAHHVDILPTVLAQLKLPAPDGVAGVSLLGSLAKTPKTRRPMFSLALPRPKRVKHLKAKVKKEGKVASVRLPPYKLIAYPGVDGPIFELFDLTKDPGERNNIAADHPAELRNYAAELAAWYGDEKTFATPPQMLPPESEEVLRSLGYVE